MRLAFRIDLTPIARCAADCTSIALPVVLFGARARDAEPAQSAHAGAAASSEATITRAATPQFMRDNSGGCSNVTLWDEIAPPLPLPIPIDSTRAAQGKLGTYQRK
jgi:hypothetical protein